MKTVIKISGTECACYGDLEDDSNFDLVFANEELDCVWVDGNPRNSKYTFSSWEEVVEVLSDIHGEIPLQIGAV